MQLMGFNVIGLRSYDNHVSLFPQPFKEAKVLLGRMSEKAEGHATLKVCKKKRAKLCRGQT